ncbi:hypothetical protein U1Q18_034837 [Sarracenia purpurea var. burkii]
MGAKRQTQLEVHASEAFTERNNGNLGTGDYLSVYNGKDKSRSREIKEIAATAAELGDTKDIGFHNVLKQSDTVVGGAIRASNCPNQMEEDDLTSGAHPTQSNLYPNTLAQSDIHNPPQNPLTTSTDPIQLPSQSQSGTHPQPHIQAQSHKQIQPKNKGQGENQPQPNSPSNIENNHQPISKTPWPHNQYSQSPQLMVYQTDLVHPSLLISPSENPGSKVLRSKREVAGSEAYGFVG